MFTELFTYYYGPGKCIGIYSVGARPCPTEKADLRHVWSQGVDSYYLLPRYSVNIITIMTKVQHIYNDQ